MENEHDAAAELLIAPIPLEVVELARSRNRLEAKNIPPPPESNVWDGDNPPPSDRCYPWCL